MKKCNYSRNILISVICSMILILSLVMGSNTPVQASVLGASSSIPVDITEGGLDPAVLAVSVGDEVVWTNSTGRTLRLLDGEPHLIYMPISVNTNSSIAVQPPSSSPGNATHSPQDIWLDAEIAPGGSFSFTFTTAGNYPYFVVGSNTHTGEVEVNDNRLLFKSVLYSPNDTGSAYVPHNDSLDLGYGSEDDFTVEMWFYVPDLTFEDTHVDPLARKDGCFSFYISFKADQPDRIYFTLTILGYGEVLLWHSTDLQIGWHHVAAVFDNEYTPSEDAFSIFLDGLRVAHSPDENIHVDWTPGLPHCLSYLEIGGVGTGGFHGYVEEARISDIVRYSGPTYTVPGGPFTPDGNIRGLWHFNEAAGSTVFMDESPYGNNLTGYAGAQTYNP